MPRTSNEAFLELVKQALRFMFDMNLDRAATGIPDFAANSKLGSDSLDESSKPNALHPSFHLDVSGNQGASTWPGSEVNAVISVPGKAMIFRALSILATRFPT